MALRKDLTLISFRTPDVLAISSRKKRLSNLESQNGKTDLERHAVQIAFVVVFMHIEV